MKILVTGGAGFIGSNFVRYILQNHPEDEVVNLDKLTYAGNLENLKDVENDKRYKFVKGDVCDVEALRQAASGVDAVVHFAAESHVDRSIHSSREFLETNVLGTENVIKVVRELSRDTAPNPSSKRRGLVYAHVSTDEVYGDIHPPHKAKETDALNPSSPYAASKGASDLLVLAAIRTHGLPAVITRCTNNYGPYQYPEKIIPLFITNLMENKKVPLYDGGTQIRDWLFVEDHCRAVDAVLRHGRVGEIYNIAAEQEPEVTNGELTKMILRVLGKSEDFIEPVSGLRPGHDQRYALDSLKIRRELDWEPLVSLEEGLARTVEWYRGNVEWWGRVKSGEYQKYYQSHYGT